MVKLRLLVSQNRTETKLTKIEERTQAVSCLWCGLGTILNRNQILFASGATTSSGLPYLEIVTTMSFARSHVLNLLYPNAQVNRGL